MLTAPPSLICTVFALTTGRDIPPRGSRVPRDAAAGAVSVIANWASASSTVDAVVQTCLVFWPSSEISSGRLRRSTMVSLSETGLIGGGEEVVAVADLETVLPDHVDHPRLHGRDRDRRTVDAERHGLVGRNGVATRSGERDEQRRGHRTQQR